MTEFNENISKSTNIKEDISEFNQKAFAHELQNAVIIKSQITDILNNNPSIPEENKANTLKMFDDNLLEMIMAENDEVYQLHELRLEHLIQNLQSKLKLDAIGEESIERAKAFHELLKKVKDISFENQAALENFKFPDVLKGKIDVDLTSLKRTNSQENFDKKKSEIVKYLLAYEADNYLNDKASMALIKSNMAQLNQVRRAYLEQETSWQKMFKDGSWVLTGVGLTVAAGVLALAAPAALIPGIVVGCGAMLYGAFDLALSKNESDESLKLGQRDIKEEQVQSIQSLAEKAPGFNVDDMLAHRNKIVERQQTKKKWLKRFTLGISALGVGLAGMAFLMLFPPLALPVAGVAVVAAISTAVALVAGGAMVYKAHQAQNEVIKTIDEIQNKVDDDKKIIESLIPAKHDDEVFHDSTKLVIEKEIQSQPRQSCCESGASAEESVHGVISVLPTEDDNIAPGAGAPAPAQSTANTQQVIATEQAQSQPAEAIKHSETINVSPADGVDTDDDEGEGEGVSIEGPGIR